MWSASRSDHCWRWASSAPFSCWGCRAFMVIHLSLSGSVHVVDTQNSFSLREVCVIHGRWCLERRWTLGMERPGFGFWLWYPNRQGGRTGLYLPVTRSSIYKAVEACWSHSHCYQYECYLSPVPSSFSCLCDSSTLNELLRFGWGKNYCANQITDPELGWTWPALGRPTANTAYEH